MIIDLNQSEWYVTGVWPWSPILGKSLETGGKLRGITPKIKAKVPGSVYDDLLAAQLIDDPYIGMNSLKCEWVESKWWNYETIFVAPELKSYQRIFLCFRGLDYKARIYLNNDEICIHEGMFLPLELEITNCVRLGKNRLHVLFEECPQEMGLGITSKVCTQKARFGYKWDFGTRLVNIGIWDDVYLKITGPGRLLWSWVRTDWNQSYGELVVYSLAEGGNKAKVCLYSPEGTEIETKEVTVTNEINTRFEIENPQLWYPHGIGQQPLYNVRIELISDGVTSDYNEMKVGIRSLSFARNEGASADSLPYTIIFNGKKVYMQGVNLTPFDHRYGCISEKEYRSYIKLLKNCNVNLVRIWGGGLIEKDIFYQLCDENGILIWQDFIQSSSGVENVPSEDNTFLELLERNAIQVVRDRRGHVSLVIWCGGNELREYPDDDNKPVTLNNKNISLLKKIVSENDAQRLFLPSSASGPVEYINNLGGHDVHGLWRYEGTRDHYMLYNTSQHLLHSEFGVDAMSSVDAVRYITGKADPPIADMETDLVWRFHGEWWDNLEKNSELFGNFNRLEHFVACSQLIQGEGIRYILEANRRRAFRNSGSIVWQFNEPWPNVSCTNLVEYSMRPKAGYYFTKRAYSPVIVSLKYDTITPFGYEKQNYTIWVSTFACGLFEIGYEVIDSLGNIIREENNAFSLEYAETQKVFDWIMLPPNTWDDLFFIRTYIKIGLKRVYENTYFFSISKKLPFQSLLYCNGSLKWERVDNHFIVANTGERVATYVHTRSDAVFEDSWICLFPGESREWKLLMGDIHSINFYSIGDEEK